MLSVPSPLRHTDSNVSAATTGTGAKEVKFRRETSNIDIEGESSADDASSSSDSSDGGRMTQAASGHYLAQGRSRHQISRGISHRISRSGVQRLLDRDARMWQSSGKIHVRHKNGSKYLWWGDLYHVIVHKPLWWLLLLFVAVYVTSFTVFAFFWQMITEPCNILIHTYRDAFYLSVETQMTIGYGVNDAYFNNCYEGVFVLLSQSLTGLVIDAMMFGVIFQHFSRAYTRASTVIFSKEAVLQVIDGCVHLIFRVSEMQEQPLLQAVMQVYCVQHHVDEMQKGGIRVEVSAVQLKEPDTDIYNGVLFLGLPTTVVHRIDYNSPLSPPPPPNPEGEFASPDEVREWLKSRQFLEVLVLLSGTEDATASSIEARHSYTLDEIFWDRYFTSCVSIDANGYHCVDFGLIHETQPMNTGSSPRPISQPPLHTHSRRCLVATYEGNR